MVESPYNTALDRRKKVLEMMNWLRENPGKSPSNARKNGFEGFYKWYQRKRNGKSRAEQGIVGYDGNLHKIRPEESIFSFSLTETGFTDKSDLGLEPEEKEKWVYLDFDNVKNRRLEALVLRDRYRAGEKQKPSTLLAPGKMNAGKMSSWYNENINGMRRCELGVIGYDGETYFKKLEESLLAFIFRETGMTRFMTEEEKAILIEGQHPKTKWPMWRVIEECVNVIEKLRVEGISLEKVTFKDFTNYFYPRRMSGIYPRLYDLKNMYIEQRTEEVRTVVDAIVYAYCDSQRSAGKNVSVDWIARRKWIKKGRREKAA